jgi:predicted esterase
VGLSGRDNENCDGIDDSVNIIREFIDAEIGLGIKANRIVLAGFSQGGALSLYCGLQLPPELKPAGILVMSGENCRADAALMMHFSIIQPLFRNASIVILLDT